MRRTKTDARLICYVSVIALSLNACSQHGGKLKVSPHLTDNNQAASTATVKDARTAHGTKTSGRWYKKRDKSSTVARSGNGKNLSQYDNLWDRLFDLYDLPPIEHNAVDRELEWFVNHPDFIARAQRRAEPFLYSIVRQIEKHDLPGELALLPVVESAFRPHAVSPAKAAGIWQFIPSTGRLYGLKQSRSYDGRRDVYASTRAAIKYLKKLHRDFNGDWLLAIAAYNCGEGAVGRAIQRNIARNRPTDFWSLDLPEETRSYVPRLLAVAKLFSDPDRYGIDLHYIPNEAVFKPVKVSAQLDLALAADAADMSLDRLLELNPGFKRQLTDVQGSYRLFIPAGKTAEFKRQLPRLMEVSRSVPTPALAKREPADEAEPQPAASRAPDRRAEPMLTAYGRYQKAAQTSSFQPERAAPFEYRKTPVAERKFEEPEHRVTVETSVRNDSVSPDSDDRTRSTEALSQRNQKDPFERRKASVSERSEGLGESRRARQSAGEIRAASKSAEKIRAERAVDVVVANDRTDRTSGKKGSYTVQAGETLWAVARKHSVDPYQLAKWNNISPTTKVQAGQSLVVWNKDSAKKLTFASSGIRPSQSIKYTVRAGDTLFSISRRFNVSVAELRKWNGSQIDKQMQPGKNIKVQGQ